MKRTMTVSTVALVIAGLSGPALAQQLPDLDASGSTSINAESGDPKTGADIGTEANTEIHTKPDPLSLQGEAEIEAQSDSQTTTERESAEQEPAEGDSTVQSQPAERPAQSGTAGLIDLGSEQAILGANVRSRDGDKIGTVRDIVRGNDGSQLIVVKVGGFLGLFGRDVAFSPSQLSVGVDGSLRTQLTEADIDAMPEYEEAES